MLLAPLVVFDGFVLTGFVVDFAVFGINDTALPFAGPLSFKNKKSQQKS